MFEKQFQSFGRFELENGEYLADLTIAYHAMGELNENKDNVIWICHALTANSNPARWWEGLVGEGKLFDPAKHYIVCANIIGSCYGTTGPLSENPETGKPYYYDFPLVTIRDIANSFELLRKHLNIDKIKLAIGGSCGGYQVLEYAVMYPDVVENNAILCSSPKESAWGVAVHTAHRSAIEVDPTWGQENKNAGLNGMKTARQIGLLFYRNSEIYNIKQKEDTENVIDNFNSSSYLKYQGEKLAKRFNAFSYHSLTRTLDTHNLARNRYETVDRALMDVKQKTLIIGIKSDLLCPVSEQLHMNKFMPNSEYVEIDSLYGHDGFLLENDTIAKAIKTQFDFI